MPEHGRFPDDFVALDRFPSFLDFRQSVRDIIQMGLGVNAPRDGEPREFEFRFQLFPGFGVAPEQEGADLAGADAGFDVEFDG